MQKIGHLGALERPAHDTPFIKGSHQREIHEKGEGVLISASMPKIKKIRTLSVLQLLKFEKATYSYFFDSWPRSRDIGNSLHLSFKGRNAHISAPGPQIRKVR